MLHQTTLKVPADDHEPWWRLQPQQMSLINFVTMHIFTWLNEENNFISESCGPLGCCIAWIIGEELSRNFVQSWRKLFYFNAGSRVHLNKKMVICANEKQVWCTWRFSPLENVTSTTRSSQAPKHLINNRVLVVVVVDPLTGWTIINRAESCEDSDKHDGKKKQAANNIWANRTGNKVAEDAIRRNQAKMKQELIF